MPDQQSTIRAGSKANRINTLKNCSDMEELLTIEHDEEGKNIPETVAKMLKASNEDLSINASKYICATQISLPAAFSNVTSKDGDSLSIQVGTGGKIPRWQKSQTKPIQWAAFSRGYPTPDHAKFAAYKLNEAARIWNGLNLGVQFKWVTALQDATFVLGYGNNLGDTAARAFFPNPNDLSPLLVYQRAFDQGVSNYMTNIFVHELGHVLGLRHEFAPEKEAGNPSVQVGPRNPLSVMGYNFPPTMQTSDRTSSKIFYDFTGTTLGGLPIDNYTPDN